MAITVTAGTPSSASAGTAVPCAVPATTAGDITYITVAVEASSAAINTPSGWTLIQGSQPNGTSNGYVGVYRRVWQSGDPSTVTFTTTVGTGRPMSCGPVLVQGADTTTPEATSAITVSGSIAASGNLPCPTVTVSSTTQYLLYCYGLRTTATTGTAMTWTQPSGTTELIDEDSNRSGFNNVSIGVASLSPGATGAAGVKNAVPSAAGNGVGISILLAPASGTTKNEIGAASVVAALTGTIANSEPITGSAALVAALSGTPSKFRLVSALPTAFNDAEYSTLNGAITSSTQVELPATSSVSDWETVATNWRLQGSQFFFQMTPPTTASGVQTLAQYRSHASNANEVRWLWNNGTLYARYLVASSTTTVNSATYDPVNHAFLQLRESGGTTYWETSPDGQPGNWTTFASAATGLDLSEGDIRFQASSGASSGFGSAFYTNLNTASTGTTKNLIGSTSLVTALSNNPTKDVPVTGSAALATGNTAAVFNARPVTGSTALATVYGGVVAPEKPVTGSAALTTVLSGTVLPSKPVIGSAALVTALDNTISRSEPVTGSIGVISVSTGAIISAITEVGSASLVTALSATASNAQPVVGSTALVTSLSALAGNAKQETGATAALTISLSGTLTKGAAGTSGDVSLVTSLSGALTNSQPVSGNASLVTNLSATPSKSVSLTASTALTTVLSGAAAAERQVSGDTSLVTSLTASTAGLGSVIGTVSLVTATSAFINTSRPARGSTRLTVSLSGTVSRTKSITGSTRLTTTLTGHDRVAKPLAGSTALSTAVSNATLRRQRLITGGTSLTTSTSGLFTKNVRLRGSTALTTVTSAGITDADSCSGTTRLQTAVHGVVTSVKSQDWLTRYVHVDGEVSTGAVDVTVPLAEETVLTAYVDDGFIETTVTV